MGRFSLDPLFFLKPDIMGQQDGKLYAEAGIIGLENYPIFYDDIMERIPVVIGFNIPTFKVLDVLSLEFEYFGNNYTNSTLNLWQNHSPVPFTGGAVPAHVDSLNLYPYKTEDDIKWSIYAKKRINNFLEFSCQFASDHTQRNDYMTGYFQVYEQLCLRPTDWYMIARLKFFL